MNKLNASYSGMQAKVGHNQMQNGGYLGVYAVEAEPRHKVIPCMWPARIDTRYSLPAGKLGHVVARELT